MPDRRAYNELIELGLIEGEPMDELPELTEEQRAMANAVTVASILGEKRSLTRKEAP